MKTFRQGDVLLRQIRKREPTGKDAREQGRVILARCELPGDEPLVMVRMRNRTPEPDGSFKHYQLRVPADMTTARQAVAWSFNMAAKEYQPDVET